MKKVLFMLLTVLVLMFVLVSCGKSQSAADGNVASEEADEETKNEKNIKKEVDFSIDDIEIECGSFVDGGKRKIGFEYTNNTNHPICELEMKFIQKSSISDEEKNAFIDELFALLADENDSEEDKNKLRQMDISMEGSIETLTNPGATSDFDDVHYYTGYIKVQDESHFNYVEPDIATIKYVDDGKIYTAYYDYRSQKFTVDEKYEGADEWSTTILGEIVPKPQCSVINSNNPDKSDQYYGHGLGMSYDEFNEYVQECKDSGFIVDSYEHDGYYRAYNNESYQLTVDYDENDKEIDISIYAPNDSAKKAVNNAVNKTSSIVSDAVESVSDVYDSAIDEYRDAYDSVLDEYNDMYDSFQEEYNNLNN